MYSRFYRPDRFIDIQIQPDDLTTLQLFNDYRILPTNYIQAFFPTRSKVGLRHRLKQLVYAGYLERFTFNGTKNLNGPMNYYRTERGDKFLTSQGFPTYRGTKAQDAHQALLDVSVASIELGVKTDQQMRIHKWSEMLKHPTMPERMKEEKHPFRFQIGDKKHVYPDGRPFVIRRADRDAHALILDEIDRDTESQTPFKEKMAGWKQVWEKRGFEQYGLSSALLRIVTTSDRHRQNVKAWTLDVFKRPSHGYSSASSTITPSSATSLP